MSVLIKGLEMPKNCDSCPCYYETEGAWRNECQVLREECAISKGRPSWCPLIELPPHGDLVDKQQMAETNEQHYLVYKGEPNADYAREVVLRMLDQAPTIIEAEVGE